MDLARPTSERPSNFWTGCPLDPHCVKRLRAFSNLTIDGIMSTTAANLAFDIYSDNIREASVFFMKTGPSTDDWAIELFPFEKTVLQFGADGGPRVVHGVARSDAAIFMLQTVETSREVYFDGHSMRWHDMAILAPGAHFTFASHAPARWLALSVSKELLNEVFSALAGSQDNPLRNKVISLSPDTASEFARVAKRGRIMIEERKAETDLQFVERSLLDALHLAFADKETIVVRAPPQLVVAEQKLKIALEYVRSRPEENIYVGDLVENVGISPRALYRCFHRYLKIGPKDYLKYRQLNLVRRALRLDATVLGHKNPVTTTFSNYGVSEFGRFALEYKRLFKELPSETVARRSATHRQSD
jgi:AraC family transcriptional regulator, ethanolamine operon transcriptional activator